MAKLLEYESIRAAESSDLYELLHEVQDVIAGRDQDALLDVVRERIKASEDLAGREVVEVIFGVDEWDNGWFYDENDTTFVFADGTREQMHGVLVDEAVAYQGNDILHEALTELSGDNGPLTGGSELTVNLSTGETDTND